MKLSGEQEQAVSQWVEDGAGLAEVQRRLQEEFGMKMTFLDTRFLVDDLKLKIKSEPAEEEDVVESEPVEQAQKGGIVNEMGQPASDSADADGAGGKVSVSLDEIAIPGTMVSGKVSFADGNSGRWSVDQMGRLSFDPDVPGYRPSEQDLQEFQAELQNLMRSGGI